MASTFPIIYFQYFFLEHSLSHYTNFPIIHANFFKLGANFCEQTVLASKAPCHIGDLYTYIYIAIILARIFCFGCDQLEMYAS